MITGEEWQAARKLWPDDEDTDFTVSVTQSGDGPSWMRLSCSGHGPLMAAVAWDLASLNATAERHYVIAHLRPRKAALTGEGPLCACLGLKGCHCDPDRKAGKAP